VTRPLLALGLAFVFVGAVVGIVLRVAVPRHPRRLDLTAADAPLTTRLLLVVVDGLRYDVATDHARMPTFAAAMTRETSARIASGRVSMTTTGVLAIGAGQWGELEQVVRNMWPLPANYDSWLENAAKHGRRIAAVGDPAWVRMYGDWLAANHVDPVNLAIDADFNDVTFAAARRLAAGNPDVLIVHFVTPDHQGHAWGIDSAQYAGHMRRYDASLDAFLHEFGAPWTVIVTSDHGATIVGTHGTDTPAERDVPLYAYGPGIRAGIHAPDPIEQVDLADTIAVLLGVELPAHGLGRPLTAWLDVAPDAARRIDASASDRSTRYGAVTTSESALALPWGTIAALLALAAALMGLALGRVPAIVWIGASTLLAVAVGLVYSVETLGGHSPNVVRSLNLAALNGLLLFGVWRRHRVGHWVSPHVATLGLLLPGMLAVTYPGYLQPESWVAIALGIRLTWMASDSPSKGWLIATLGLVAIISPLGFLQEPYGSIPLDHPTLVRVLAAGSLVGWLALRRFSIPVALLLIVPLWTRPLVPASAGRLLIATFAVGAAIAALKGRWRLAAPLVLTSYLWVARDVEVPAVVALLVVADLLATRFVQTQDSTSESEFDFAACSTAAVLFALIFLLRIGVQSSLDFGGMDWRAAAFDDAETPVWTITAGIAWKHISVMILLAATAIAPLTRAMRDRVVALLLGAFALRGATLLLMLLVCRTSYWTMLRVIGDLPHALMGLVVAAGVWVAGRTIAVRRATVPV
jgi:hypothetical protein